jgi:hypothetical protein
MGVGSDWVGAESMRTHPRALLLGIAVAVSAVVIGRSFRDTRPNQTNHQIGELNQHC